MLKRIPAAASILVIAILSLRAMAESPKPATVPSTQDAPVINLWPDGKVRMRSGIRRPTRRPCRFFCRRREGDGSAIVVCPGGGYGGLAQHEGPKVGQWLAENGIAGFVLRYRLGPKYHYPAEIEDGQRAVRYVRAHAVEWKIDPRRIGIIGFSRAGIWPAPLRRITPQAMRAAKIRWIEFRRGRICIS